VARQVVVVVGVVVTGGLASIRDAVNEGEPVRLLCEQREFTQTVAIASLILAGAKSIAMWKLAAKVRHALGVCAYAHHEFPLRRRLELP